MSHGDVKTFLASLSPNAPELEKARGKSEDEIAAEWTREFDRVTGFRIIDKEAVSNDEVILTIHARGIDDFGKFRVQRVGNDWKLAGPVKGDRNAGPK